MKLFERIPALEELIPNGPKTSVISVSICDDIMVYGTLITQLQDVRNEEGEGRDEFEVGDTKFVFVDELAQDDEGYYYQISALDTAEWRILFALRMCGVVPVDLRYLYATQDKAEEAEQYIPLLEEM